MFDRLSLLNWSFAFLVTALCPLCLISDNAFAKDKTKDPEEIGNRNVGKGVNFYSLEREIALGRQMAGDVERQAKIMDDPVIAEYVSRVGQNLVRNSDAKIPFTIKLLDSEEVNAFALPGGFFFVNSGLVLTTESESELAGVMAHEIAHVAARHGTKQATRGEIINLASIPLIFVGGMAGELIREGAGLAIPLGMLQFSQSYEREADYLGLQYLYKAGYDPASFVDFFERVQSLEKKKSGTLTKLFSTHPMTSSRIKSAQREIQKILVARSEYVVNTSEFDHVKDRLVMLHNLRKVDTPTSLPHLRQAPGPRSGRDNQTTDNDNKPDQDDRPTLKRRPDL